MNAGWGPSLEHRMMETGGRATGFDYLRLLLACSVIVWHAFGVTHGMDFTFKVEDSPIRPLIMVILPMFFGLSGFLVAGSLFRNPAISTFLGLRAIRIFPALAVESLLSAWIIGSFLTTLPLSEYFLSAQFWKYHMNIIGDIHYYLPGLFKNNPISMVNAQLATVPWELECYVSLTVLALIGLVKKPRIFFCLILIATCADFILHTFVRHSAAFAHSNVGSSNLVFTFLAAVGLYGIKDLVPWSRRLAVMSAFTLILLFEIPGGDYLCAVPAAYLTVYLGLMNPRKVWFLRGADYSYGVYLYGFVVQQTVEQFGWARHWWLNMPISLCGAAMFAALSWHLVEKPALKFRRFLPSIEDALSHFRLPGAKSAMKSSN